MQGECNDTPLLLYLAAMYSVLTQNSKTYRFHYLEKFIADIKHIVYTYKQKNVQNTFGPYLYSIMHNVLRMQ